MSLRIIKQGLFDTIQDDGRYGFQHLGINPNGVMDMTAAAIANILIGNNASDAVIELHFPAAVILFEKPCLIALSGADFTATINDEIVLLNTTLIVGASSQLLFKKYKSGARCYLAVHGGFKLDKWLNSYSTNIKTKAGGYKGRALQKNDVLHFCNKQFFLKDITKESFITTNIKIDTAAFYTTGKIFYTKGRQYNWLTENAKKLFEVSSFIISRQSDRMGYKLDNEILEVNTNTQLKSSAVTKGAVQLLPEGKLIILMADHQTTGGYPVVANIISAHIPSLAQMQPGQGFQLDCVIIEEAENLYIQQQEKLINLHIICKQQLNNFFAEYDFN